MNGTQERTLITIGATGVRLSCGGMFYPIPPQDSMYVSVEREGGDAPIRMHAVNNGTVYEAAGVLNPGDIVILDVLRPRDCQPVMCGRTPIRLGVFSLSLYADTGESWKARRPIRTKTFLYGSDWDYELLEEYLRSCRKQQPKPTRRVHLNCIPECVHPTSSTFSYN